MPLELIMESQPFLESKILTKALNSYLDKKGIKQIVSLILIDDNAIQKLNLRDSGIDKATDVLSYSMHEPDDIDMPEVEQLGDVFISLETAQKQAIDHNHSLLDEVLVLAAHGITHLRGYNHDSPENWQIFLNEQKLVLELKQY